MDLQEFPSASGSVGDEASVKRVCSLAAKHLSVIMRAL